MQPTLGRIVHYKLSEHDVTAIKAVSDATPAQGHRNPVTPGQVYPATVTAVFGGSTANLVVQLDGLQQHWVTSRTEGDEPGQWCWPPRG